ncbi:hypothetical protein AURDEDRAFT_176276 [Auricularia subglabra TFB-10046 SS5]|uniref:Uncharacterized protein n=1 Tax=Auricularia subglabra (strain TFB-10046 / SS5) TaxID=717982 RepID=J0D6Y7_AURST|nr:hypothetical protein AURDEDRAFT_176276 [Auricularia subglabra TFB-10046 SS5]
MTVFAALKLVYKRLFPKAKPAGTMPRSRSASVEPCAYGYMPSDTLFAPIIEAFNAPPEPRWTSDGNAGGHPAGYDVKEFDTLVSEAPFTGSLSPLLDVTPSVSTSNGAKAFASDDGRSSSTSPLLARSRSVWVKPGV